MRITPLGLAVFLSGSILLIISTSVPILRFAKTPAGRQFAGDQFYTDDYNAYAETIRQGIDGRWTVIDKFTSEPHRSSLFRIFYLYLGKVIGAPTKLLAEHFFLQPAAVVYHLARFVLGAFLLWLIWQFIKVVFPEAPPTVTLSAWLLTLFANVWPKSLSAVFSFPWDWQALEPSFREPEVTTRFFSQPHFLAGYVITFTIFILFIKFIKGSFAVHKVLGFIFLLAFLGAWIEPTPIVLLALASWIYAGLLSLVFYGKSNQWPKMKMAIMTAAFLSLALIPAALYYQNLRQQLPWSNNTIYESRQDFYKNVGELFPVFGLPLILGASGMVITLSDKKRIVNWELTLLLLSVVIGFFLLFYPLAPVVMINRLRIFRQPVFVIFDIFAALAIYWLADKIAQWQIFSKDSRQRATAIFVIVLTLITILPGIPSAIWFLRNQYMEYANLPSFAYPSTEELDAFKWLESHTSRNSTVAALYEAGSLIPQFSGNTTYLGNVVETINFGQKTDLLGKFFAGQMDIAQARQFLTEGRINYLYWGFQERSLGGNPLSYNFVSQAYANPGVTIFKVNTSN